MNVETPPLPLLATLARLAADHDAARAAAARHGHADVACVHQGGAAGIGQASDLVTSLVATLATRRAALIADGETDYAAGITFALSLIGGAA